MQPVNPYQPVDCSHGELDLERITFEGYVHAEDVVDVLRSNDWKVTAAATVLSIVIPLLILPGAWSMQGVSILLVLSLGLAVAIRFAVRSNRTSVGIISLQNPKLIGAIDGWLSQDGVFFRPGDEPYTHLLSWSACRKINVTSRGVLIRWGLDRLVIVPLHCFNAFHASAVRKRIKQFRSLDKRDPFYRVLADWSTIGTDAVRFEMRTTVGASRKTETGVDLQWYQWGFFDQEGLTVVIVDKKKRILWEEVRQVKIDDRSVKVLFPNHDLFEVPRSAFLDDDWQDLSKWRASVAAILNVVGQDGAPPRH